MNSLLCPRKNESIISASRPWPSPCMSASLSSSLVSSALSSHVIKPANGVVRTSSLTLNFEQAWCIKFLLRFWQFKILHLILTKNKDLSMEYIKQYKKYRTGANSRSKQLTLSCWYPSTDSVTDRQQSDYPYCYVFYGCGMPIDFPPRNRLINTINSFSNLKKEQWKPRQRVHTHW